MPALQLAILVLDASGSMSVEVSGVPQGTTKAWQIEDMLLRPLPQSWETADDRRELLLNCGLIARLQHSQRKDNIDMGLIRYDNTAEVYQGNIRPITDWELSQPAPQLTPPNHYMLGGQTFDLLQGKGGGTNIVSGLEAAEFMKDEWLNKNQTGNNECFVTILLMSDMLHNEGSPHEPVKVATRIKRNVILRERPQVLLAAAAFGDDADLSLMTQIASGQEYAVKTTDPIKLRDFFLSSLSAQQG